MHHSQCSPMLIHSIIYTRNLGLFLASRLYTNAQELIKTLTDLTGDTFLQPSSKTFVRRISFHAIYHAAPLSASSAGASDFIHFGLVAAFLKTASSPRDHRPHQFTIDSNSNRSNISGTRGPHFKRFQSAQDKRPLR